MQIIQGAIKKPVKLVVYGPEGIGKSTFASHMPDPLFIDTEGSTTFMDVKRFEAPTSWTMLEHQIDYVIKNKPCKTLVVDTVDWGEHLAKEHLIQKNSWTSIETPGYGKGYTALAELFAKCLNRLSDVIDAGINVCITAHAAMRKFEQPDEMGAYDRWELKLEKKVTPLVKEWADVLLFANYETNIVTDSKTKSKKATGGKRVIHTVHHPAWDAKNRFNLPEKLPFEFAEIAHIFDAAPQTQAVTAPPAEQATPPQAVQQQATSNIDKRLADLLKIAEISEEQLERALGPSTAGGQGFWPAETRLSDYPPDFVDHVIGNWAEISTFVKNMDASDLPFEL